jgi:hypothetical protein
VVKYFKSFLMLIVCAIVLFSSACQAGSFDPGKILNPATATPTIAPSSTSISTSTPIPTNTRPPTRTPRPQTPTPDEDQKATSIAADRSSVITELFNQKLLKSGDYDYYYALDGLDENWAQLFWYQWWETGMNAKNFVVQADIQFDSASNIANWPDSGCGFVYNAVDTDNHHITYLGMDGNIYSFRTEKGLFTRLKTGYYGKLKVPADSAKITLIVEDQWVTFLVNDKKTVHFEDMRLGQGGDIAFTLVSGTNKDYGTHCVFENVEAWVLPEGL